MTNDSKNTQLIPLATVFVNPKTNQLHLNVSDNVPNLVEFCLSVIQMFVQVAGQAQHKKTKQNVLRVPPGSRVQ